MFPVFAVNQQATLVYKGGNVKLIEILEGQPANTLKEKPATVAITPII